MNKSEVKVIGILERVGGLRALKSSINYCNETANLSALLLCIVHFNLSSVTKSLINYDETMVKPSIDSAEIAIIII